MNEEMAQRASSAFPCDRGDDLRPVPADGTILLPYFHVMEEIPGFETILTTELETLRRALVDASESLTVIKKDNARLRFMMNIDIPLEAPICRRCPLTKV